MAKMISRNERIQVSENWATNGKWLILRGMVNHLLPAEIRHVPLATWNPPPGRTQLSNANEKAMEEIIAEAAKGEKSWRKADDTSFTIRLDTRTMRILVSAKTITLFNQEYLDLLPAWNVDKIRIDGEGRLLYLEDGKIQGMILKYSTPEEKIRNALSAMAGASFSGEEG